MSVTASSNNPGGRGRGISGGDGIGSPRRRASMMIEVDLQALAPGVHIAVRHVRQRGVVNRLVLDAESSYQAVLSASEVETIVPSATGDDDILRCAVPGVPEEDAVVGIEDRHIAHPTVQGVADADGTLPGLRPQRRRQVRARRGREAPWCSSSTSSSVLKNTTKNCATGSMAAGAL